MSKKRKLYKLNWVYTGSGAAQFNLPYPGVDERRNKKLAEVITREYRKRKDYE